MRSSRLLVMVQMLKCSESKPVLRKSKECLQDGRFNAEIKKKKKHLIYKEKGTDFQSEQPIW